MSYTDLILTWPKTRPLESYVEEMKKAAEREDMVVNFRVNQPPQLQEGDRLWGRAYMVHDGSIRGYSHIVEVTYREEGEVARVESDAFAGFWPEGWYVVRESCWCPLREPVAYRGFQGFRYVKDPDLHETLRARWP